MKNANREQLYQNSAKDRTPYFNISIAAKGCRDNNKLYTRKYTVEKSSLV